MNRSKLNLPATTVEVSPAQLKKVKVPPSGGRWHPCAHSHVLDTIIATLSSGGYTIVRQVLTVNRHGQRFFGVLDLNKNVTKGVLLSVGIRNSVDKSYPMGFCAGSRVSLCDNLAFNSELLVKYKHTRFGEGRFVKAIDEVVELLRPYRQMEAERIAKMQKIELTNEQAALLLIQTMEKGIIPPLTIPKVWQEWLAPSFDYGSPTVWRLLNSFTAVLRQKAKRVPNEYAGMTMRLNQLLMPDDPF